MAGNLSMADNLWPPPENEVADAKALPSQISAAIAQIEQTLSQAKLHLAALTADAPHLHEILTSTEFETNRPRLADLKDAQGLRMELVKAAQQSVAVSQSAAEYLQARERFLQARRAWTARAGQ